jgi:predicted SAM-dependent methyltransferase
MIVVLRRRVVRFLDRKRVFRRLPASSAGFTPGYTLDFAFSTRDFVAKAYLTGCGIEIGAAYAPTTVRPDVQVTYVDRLSADGLRAAHPELGSTALVNVDVIDDGERLPTIGDATQDFVVANHFLEHCEDPIATLSTLLRVTRPGGVLMLAIPDQRHSCDVRRPCTPFEHVRRDFIEGPAWSKRQHVEEWSRLVNERQTEADVQEEVAHLLNIGASIHYHVWRAPELLQFLTGAREYLDFELELFLRNGFENVVILRKPA